MTLWNHWQISVSVQIQITMIVRLINTAGPSFFTQWLKYHKQGCCQRRNFPKSFLARFQTKQRPALFLNLNNRYLSRNVGFYSSHAKNISIFMSVRAQSCPTLCNPMGCRPPGSSVHGILQAETLGWIAVSTSRGSSWPKDWTWVSYVGKQILYH